MTLRHKLGSPTAPFNKLGRAVCHKTDEVLFAIRIKNLLSIHFLQFEKIFHLNLRFK
jgi:hypothetical protein